MISTPLKPPQMDRETYLETRIAILETHLLTLLEEMASQYNYGTTVHGMLDNTRARVDGDLANLASVTGEPIKDSYQLLQLWDTYAAQQTTLLNMITPRGPS